MCHRVGGKASLDMDHEVSHRSDYHQKSRPTADSTKEKNGADSCCQPNHTVRVFHYVQTLRNKRNYGPAKNGRRHNDNEELRKRSEIAGHEANENKVSDGDRERGWGT